MDFFKDFQNRAETFFYKNYINKKSRYMRFKENSTTYFSLFLTHIPGVYETSKSIKTKKTTFYETFRRQIDLILATAFLTISQFFIIQQYMIIYSRTSFETLSRNLMDTFQIRKYNFDRNTSIRGIITYSFRNFLSFSFDRRFLVLNSAFYFSSFMHILYFDSLKYFFLNFLSLPILYRIYKKSYTNYLQDGFLTISPKTGSFNSLLFLPVFYNSIVFPYCFHKFTGYLLGFFSSPYPSFGLENDIQELKMKCEYNHRLKNALMCHNKEVSSSRIKENITVLSMVVSYMTVFFSVIIYSPIELILLRISSSGSLNSENIKRGLLSIELKEIGGYFRVSLLKYLLYANCYILFKFNL